MANTWGYCFSLTTAGVTAMSPAELRCMARALNELLVRAGLRTAWKKAVWCTSAPDSLVANAEVENTVITRTRREQGVKALGVWVTLDGHFVKELAEREVIARRSFFAIRKLLCDNRVTLRHRLRLLSSCITSSLYWYSGSWILTQSQCTHLRAIQDKVLRRTIYVLRIPIENTRSPPDTVVKTAALRSSKSFAYMWPTLPGFKCEQITRNFLLSPSVRQLSSFSL